jgi:hypothetical protein
MEDWEDDDDDSGDLEPFDPTKSVVKINSYFDYLDVVCKKKFIDLYCQQFPNVKLDKKEFFKKFPVYGTHLFIETYVEGIIRHYYYHPELPFEDDLMPVDKANFPSNAEIKRFLKEHSYSNDFYSIDRYTNSQPSDNGKDMNIESLLEYFKLLKFLVFQYYPQLSELPARGFRELERSLYTLNYIFWISLHEAKDRMLGINKAFYDELDQKLIERNKKLNERWEKEKNEKASHGLINGMQ